MIKLQETVKRETLRVAAGTAVLTVLMVAVFLLLGFFDWSVLLGAVYGCFFAVLNFFLMALSVQKAAESMNGVQLPPEEETTEGENQGEAPEKPLSPQATRAKSRMQLSYMGRMLMVVVMAVVALNVSWLNPVAAIMPQLFPRLAIQLLTVGQKKRKEV